VTDAERDRRVAGLVGLGHRARSAVVGVERVRETARRGGLALVVVAPDASHHSLAKVIPLLKARRVAIVAGPSAAALGAAVGREATVAVGIVDRDLARGIRAVARSAPGGGSRGGVF